MVVCRGSPVGQCSSEAEAVVGAGDESCRLGVQEKRGGRVEGGGGQEGSAFGVQGRGGRLPSYSSRTLARTSLYRPTTPPFSSQPPFDLLALPTRPSPNTRSLSLSATMSLGRARQSVYPAPPQPSYWSTLDNCSQSLHSSCSSVSLVASPSLFSPPARAHSRFIYHQINSATATLDQGTFDFPRLARVIESRRVSRARFLQPSATGRGAALPLLLRGGRGGRGEREYSVSPDETPLPHQFSAPSRAPAPIAPPSLTPSPPSSRARAQAFDTVTESTVLSAQRSLASFMSPQITELISRAESGLEGLKVKERGLRIKVAPRLPNRTEPSPSRTDPDPPPRQLEKRLAPPPSSSSSARTTPLPAPDLAALERKLKQLRMRKEVLGRDVEGV